MTRGRAIAFVALVVTTFAAQRAAAAPEIGISIGRSFAVASPALRWEGRRPGQTPVYETDKPAGGFVIGGTVLWPIEDRFRVGVAASIVDAGSWLFQEGPWRAAQGGGGTTPSFGTLELAQLDVWSAAWRGDVLGPKLRHWGRPYATATWGYYRWRIDQTRAAGAPLAVSDSLKWGVGRQAAAGAAQSAVGASLAFGLEHEVATHQTLGIVVGGSGLSSDFTRGFMTAQIEWRWRP